MPKFFKHLKTVRKHRKFVRKWCFKMGIPLRGILHDLSKYSLKEIRQYKYYTGNRSPHDNMREEKGYSDSWCFHRNRNKHHWEFWIDSLENKTAVKIPYKYLIEMFCDVSAAGQVYNPNWKTSSVMEYYKLHDGPHRILHRKTKELYEFLLEKLASFENEKDFFEWYKNMKTELRIQYEND